MLIATKADLRGTNEDHVTLEEGQQLADANALPFVETSAKTGDNVQQAFELFLKSVITTVIKNWST